MTLLRFQTTKRGAMSRRRTKTEVDLYALAQLSFVTTPVALMLVRTSLEAMVVASFPASADALDRRTRGTASTTFARQVAMYLAHVSLGLNFTRVGAIFNRDRTTASHACSVIEDARDDKLMDRTLEVLEAASRMTIKRSFDFENKPRVSARFKPDFPDPPDPLNLDVHRH
jgi:hypothetical protein